MIIKVITVNKVLHDSPSPNRNYLSGLLGLDRLRFRFWTWALRYKTMVILTIEPVSIPITIQTGSDELPGYEPSRPALWRLISLANQH